MDNTETKIMRDGHGSHLVIICDEGGIFDAFNLIIKRLAEGRGIAFLSLIYTVSFINLYPLFEQEIRILEKRFPNDLIVHIVRIETTKYFFQQELLEATINSNTMPIMKFSVYGVADFVNYVSGILKFLDVKELFIQSVVTE